MFSRKILFEFEDLKWFPDVIRSGMTDYLRYLLTALHFYKPVVPLIREAMVSTDSYAVIDLCSGGGGPVEQIYGEFKKSGVDVKFIVTDKFPNFETYKFLEEKTGSGISYFKRSVDAGEVPAELRGVRTLFSGFHHFDPAFAKSVLKDAVDNNSAICIFDGGNKNFLMILGAIFIHPLIFIFCTPFFKPFRLSRMIFTYLIPLIPFCTMWDGVVSIIRLYSPGDLMTLTKDIDKNNFQWRSGYLKSSFGLRICYLVGIPA